MLPDATPAPRSRWGGAYQILGQLAPWLVLGLGLVATAWAWRALVSQERSYQQSRLGAALAQTRVAVDHRLEEQSKLLLGAQGLVVGRPRLVAEDWRAFVASLDLDHLSPGTTLLAYVPREALEGRRGAGVLMEPDSAVVALGLRGGRFWEQSSFREAYARARDEGEVAVTGRLPGLPGGPAQVAFLLPVFRDFAAPGSLEGRRASLQGLVVCLTEAGMLFRTMYGAGPIAGLDVEIYDDVACRPENLLYDRGLCGGKADLASSPAARRMPVPVGGRHWGLAVGFVPEGGAMREGRPRLVAIGGAAVSLLAFAMTLFLASSRGKLEALAHRLRESEGRFRSVAETAACAIFIYSDRMEYMNSAGVRMSGYSLGEILGSPLWKLVHPLDQDLVRGRAVARLSGGSVPMRYEFRLLTKEGETRWIDFSAGTVELGGRVLGLGTAFDVTERVLANEARLRVERKLLEAQRLESLGLLAGGVAHDFNNLITVIQGNAGMLREVREEPGLAQACLRNIEDTCRRASDLVRQMLAYSGRGRVDVQLLDLNRVVQEIGQLLSVSIPRVVTLRYDLAADLLPVAADAAQIQQVVMNLVTNAAEAIGEVQGTVTLRSGMCSLGEADLTGLRMAEALKPGRFVWLEVEDTGAGMDGATQARIFEPFFTTKFTGRGLGLAAMQGIVRGHGGGVSIRSAPGEGTSFRVYFPAQAGEVAAARPPEATTGGSWRGRGLVLVAEDEPGIRDFVRAALVRTGFEVLLAEDGEEAVALFLAHRREVRLVLLDLAMPRMGGEEALAGIRAVEAEIPVIRWSGHAPSGGRADARTGFLEKPFRAEDLMEEIRRLLPDPS